MRARRSLQSPWIVERALIVLAICVSTITAVFFFCCIWHWREVEFTTPDDALKHGDFLRACLLSEAYFQRQCERLVELQRDISDLEATKNAVLVDALAKAERELEEILGSLKRRRASEIVHSYEGSVDDRIVAVSFGTLCAEAMAGGPVDEIVSYLARASEEAWGVPCVLEI